MSEDFDVLEVMTAACCVLAIDKKADPQMRLNKARDVVGQLIDFRDRVAQIADDFHPDRDSDSKLALAEMREALSEALELVKREV